MIERINNAGVYLLPVLRLQAFNGASSPRRIEQQKYPLVLKMPFFMMESGN